MNAPDNSESIINENVKQENLLAQYVFIDASIYRAMQFDWDGKWFNALIDLANRGILKVLITEITRREVSSLFHETWQQANKAIISSSIALKQQGLSDALAVMANEKECLKRMEDAFDVWLKKTKSIMVKRQPNLASIIDDYFEKRPPFGPGKKKSEFPDAITVSILRKWCEDANVSAYLVSQDADMKSCCTHGGPFFHALSIQEIVSHATASVAVHNAIVEAITDSAWFYEGLQESVADLDVTFSPGWRRGGKIELETRSVKLADLMTNEVIVDSFDGTNMSCTVYIGVELKVEVLVQQEPVQYGEDDWDPGSYFTQYVYVSPDLTASVSARVTDKIAITLIKAELDDRRAEISWHEVESQIE